MTSRRNRRANVKARVGIAAAVLIGGGAIGVTVVTASSHGAANSTAQSAGFSSSTPDKASLGTALVSAISLLRNHQGKALTTLATQLSSVTGFSEATVHHTTFAAQRGIVVSVKKGWVTVKSANGSKHSWWLGGTKVVSAASSATAMMALTGTGTATGTATAVASPTATATAPAATTHLTARSIKAGATVLLVGVQAHHLLIAKLVVFAPAGTVTTAVTPTATPTASATTPAVTPTATPTTGVTPAVTPTATATAFSGNNA